VRVALADDSALFRDGVVRLLSEAGHEVLEPVGDAERLLELVARERPDIAVIDVRMPPTHTDEGLLAALSIREQHRQTRVLILSQYVESYHAIRLLSDDSSGVGYLLKDRVASTRDFVQAIERVGAGDSVIDPEVVSQLLRRSRGPGPLDELTAREREVLSLMAEGYSNQGIRQRLVLSNRTVESHVRSIFLKLNLRANVEGGDRRVLAVLTYLRG
jgi:DNA-binding NarL/FixJ family response regulator